MRFDRRGKENREMSQSMSVSRPVLGRDLTAGMAVFFVALPLCLGVALASNAPVMAGLISGAIGGIVGPAERFAHEPQRAVARRRQCGIRREGTRCRQSAQGGGLGDVALALRDARAEGIIPGATSH